MTVRTAKRRKRGWVVAQHKRCRPTRCLQWCKLRAPAEICMVGRYLGVHGRVGCAMRRAIFAAKLVKRCLSWQRQRSILRMPGLKSPPQMDELLAFLPSHDSYRVVCWLTQDGESGTQPQPTLRRAIGRQAKVSNVGPTTEQRDPSSCSGACPDLPVMP
jgi:hypothetical protein